MRTCRILTDAGPAYVKCLGNPEGPHALACEWIGTRIADMLGLETLDFAIFELRDEDVPFTGGNEEQGPCFATKAEEGFTWAGDVADLKKLANPEDLTKLILVDTYLLNWDRHPPEMSKVNKDNVYLSQERASAGSCRLIAMDFTHCLSQGKPIDEKLGRIDKVKDERLYGLFEQFAPYITLETVGSATQALSKITDSTGEWP